MASIFYISLFVLIILGIRIGLFKLFEKAGEAGWKAFIPVYSDYVWVKLIGKPIWWVALTLIPIVRTLIKISMDIELAKAYGKYKFSEQALAVILPFYYYPKIGFDPKTAYAGVPMTYEEAYQKYQKEKGKKLEIPSKKANKGVKESILKRNMKILSAEYDNVIPFKSGGREWADAFLFAGVAALIIRTFFVEAFMIPTSSMERTLMAGDFLFVSKYHYGSRMPMNPLSIPFVHNKIKVRGVAVPSYVDLFRLPYYRLPGLSKVERNDIVVFNYPAHDVHDLGDGAGTIDLISMKENYIKRCVAIPGDVLEIDNGQLFINGEKGWNPPEMQFMYDVNASNDFKFDPNTMEEMGFRKLEKSGIPDKNSNWFPTHYGYKMNASQEIVGQLQNASEITTVIPNFTPKGEYTPGERELMPGRIAIFPNELNSSKKRLWKHNRDNFMKIVIPKKGATVDLTDPRNYTLYRRVVEAYEGHDLKIQNGKPYIDGKESLTYTFEKDYYFMMGDNRHNSQDSRYWGFVPEDHIVGRPLFIFFSYERSFGIRWSRIGTKHIK